MTDVGLHTGGAPRDTCWPLVCAALRQALPPSTALADKVLLTFSASLLEEEFDRLAQSTTSKMDVFWSQVDKYMEMLDKIALSVIARVEEGYDGAEMLVKCQQWRSTLDKEVAKWNEHHAKRFRLPRENPRQYPTLSPPCQQPFDTKVSRSSIWSAETLRAMSQPFVFIDSELCSPQDLLAFLNTVTSQEDAKVTFGRRAIEKRLLLSSSSLSDTTQYREWHPVLLLQILMWYGDHQANEFDVNESRRLEQQSMMVVLSWIAFCHAHRYCTTEYDEVREFRIVLDWQRLDVCVFRERLARQAILCITEYIRDWNQRVPGPSLFDLSDHSGTMALARQLGMSLVQNVYINVQEQWQVKCQSAWAEISKRKRELESERQKLKCYEAKLANAKQLLQHEEFKLHREWKNTNAPIDRCKLEIRRWENLIHMTTNNCNSLRHMPEVLVSSLPSNEAEALQVLCLIALPEDLDILAELCWRAQRSLSPTSTRSNPSSTTSHTTRSKPGSTGWYEHFSLYSDVVLAKPTRYAIAYPSSLRVPRYWGPESIDDVNSIQSFVNSCSWFPDITNSSVHWRDSSPGGCGEWTNPFLVDVVTSRRLFTPQMVDTDWQWAVEYPIMDALERGNSIYSHWRQLCGGEDGLLEFCGRGELRAYPTQQLRRVFESIEADSLTWSNPTVVCLVRQALYHVGEINATHTLPRLMWHEDLEDDASVEAFCASVGRLVDDLDHSPRRWESLPLVSEIVGFLCQYTPQAKPLVRKLSNMASRWAEEANRLQQQEGISDQDQMDLRVRKCILYGYGALCYDHYGEQTVEDDDIEVVCGLVAQFAYAKIFVTSQTNALIDTLQTNIFTMMANRIGCNVKSLKNYSMTSERLTRLCRLITLSVPENVAWQGIDPGGVHRFTCCFITSVDSTDEQHLMNVFTGAIETNGSLPTLLPASIRQMPCYRNLFEKLEFEVTRRGDVYKTTQNYSKSMSYQFHIDQVTKELLVEEHGSDVILQLCSEEWCRQFRAVFPRRLSDLYTHWYWIDQNAVFVRTPRVFQAQVHFVVKFDAMDCALCYEVSPPDRGMAYDQLVSRLSQYPVFVVAGTKLLDVLQKFEDSAYVHVRQLPNPQAALEIYLPRFKLRFQEDMHHRWRSLNHRGFVLSTEQQLSSGQMPRFRQYILLESDDPIIRQRRLLIPTGQVKSKGSSGPVTIVVSDDPAAVVAFSTIDEHPRLETFTPNTIDTQLQLAAIYAASDSRLPWKDLGMTGGEASMRLLRGCCPSRPFSTQALQYLESIAKCFAYRTPVLTLLAAQLVQKSVQLGFLFDYEHTVSIQNTDTVGRVSKQTEKPF